MKIYGSDDLLINEISRICNPKESTKKSVHCIQSRGYTRMKSNLSSLKNVRTREKGGGVWRFSLLTRALFDVGEIFGEKEARGARSACGITAAV